MPKAKATETAIDGDSLKIVVGIAEVCILGTRPLICNRLSEKTKRELL